MAHETFSPDWQAERYRKYLKLQARLHLDPRLQSKFDSSDYVQDTLAKAWQNRHQFRGKTEGQLLGFLKRILANHLLDVLDQFKGQKRDIDREQPIQQAVDESSRQLRVLADNHQETPDVEAERNERELLLAEALAQLDEPVQQVLVLKFFKGCTLAEIAATLGQPETVVARNLGRGLKLVGNLLPPDLRKP